MFLIVVCVPSGKITSHHLLFAAPIAVFDDLVCGCDCLPFNVVFCLSDHLRPNNGLGCFSYLCCCAWQSLILCSSLSFLPTSALRIALIVSGERFLPNLDCE